MMFLRRVVLLGHKDHGKSTLIGNLLIVTKSVSLQRINDAKKTSKQLGRKFEPGFILDSFEEEREGGLTIDTTRAQIMYKGKAFELIDVPGHEELIKNMISGASNADFAVLMVSAQKGEGIKDQTLRHLFLAKMLGISRIIIAVNKMDSVKYSKGKFDEVKSKLLPFLLNIGFGEKEVSFVPISAYNSENLATKSKNMKWYNGNSLLDLMVMQHSSKENQSHDLRISVQGTIEDKKDRLIIGKVISGKIRQGETVVMLPKGIRLRASKLYSNEKLVKQAVSGQNLALRTENKTVGDIRGAVICSAKDQIKPKMEINALVFAVKKPPAKTTMRFNGNSLDCGIHINKVIDTTTGNETKSTIITPLNAAKVTISLSRALLIEPFKKSEELGRFVLYDKSEFAGIGIIV